MSVYIIAEAGVNHNGDIELAKKLIDMAHECGANAVKFQTFRAEESTGIRADKAEYQIKNDPTLESQFKMIKKLELPFSDFLILQNYSKEKGIDFISTPDGTESLQFLLKMNIPTIKIGSTEVNNYSFLKEVAYSKKPIILSTGMSTLGEVEKAIECIEEAGNNNIQLMHCTTDYPTEVKDVNLRTMVTLKEAFQIPVGFSDHTLGFEAAIAAVTLGAVCIEKHITLDRSMKGPDHRASMPPDEFCQYVQYIRNTEILLGNGRKRPTQNEKIMMKQARRSILAKENLVKGTVLTAEMICYKRPGTGIAPEYSDILIGRKLKRSIAKEEIISWEDV